MVYVYTRLKGEVERLEVEYNENISKEQAKYNMEINKLKDQIFENDVIQKTLEKEVCYFIIFLLNAHVFVTYCCYLIYNLITLYSLLVGNKFYIINY